MNNTSYLIAMSIYQEQGFFQDYTPDTIDKLLFENTLLLFPVTLFSLREKRTHFQITRTF